jgi:23S rRNA G2069 N7-methylase RlmK/C1962 C5-methylase RlmI
LPEKLTSRQASGEYKCKPQIKLLEYDERFAVFKEFVKYDFEKAIQLPAELKSSFDRIIIDPPFISEDCQTKSTHSHREAFLVVQELTNIVALTVRWLAKSWTPDSLRFIACTGERVESLLLNKLYGKAGTKTTDYELVHAKGLSNEFRCYANYECEAWKWVDLS